MPSVVIVSTPFVALAKSQCQAEGLMDPAYVVIPHPYKILTRDQVRDLADRIFESIVSRLVARDAPVELTK